MIPGPLASLDESQHEQDFSLVHSSSHHPEQQSIHKNNHAQLLEEADTPDFYVGKAMLIREVEPAPDSGMMMMKRSGTRRSLWKSLQKNAKDTNSGSARTMRSTADDSQSPKKTLSPISVMEFMAPPSSSPKNNSKHQRKNKNSSNSGSQHSRGRKSQYQQIDQANDAMEHHTERQLQRYSNKLSRSQRSLQNKSQRSLQSIDLMDGTEEGDISETESFLASTHEEDFEKIQHLQQPIIASSSNSLIESLWTQKTPSAFSKSNNNAKTLQRHSYHHRSTAFLDSEEDDLIHVRPRRPRARSASHVFDAVFPDTEDFAAEFVAQAKAEAKEKRKKTKKHKKKSSRETSHKHKKSKDRKKSKSKSNHRSSEFEHSESASNTEELNLVEEIARAIQAEDDDEYYEEEVVEEVVPEAMSDEESHTGWEDQDEQSIDGDELETSHNPTTTSSSSLQESVNSFASAFSELYQVIQDCKTAPTGEHHSESSTTASMTLSDKSLHSQKSVKSKKKKSSKRGDKKAPRRSKSEHSKQSLRRSKPTSSSKKKVKRSKSHHDVMQTSLSSSKHSSRHDRDGEDDGLSDRQRAKLLHRLERKLVKLEAKLQSVEQELSDTKKADAVIINGLQETVHSQQARMKEQQTELIRTRGALDSLRQKQHQQRRRDSIPGPPQRQGSGDYDDSDAKPKRRSVVHLLGSLVDDDGSNDGTVNLLPKNSDHQDMPGLDDVTSLEAADYESEEEDLAVVLQSIDRKVDTLLENSDLASVDDLDEQLSTMSKELQKVSPAKKQHPKRRKSRQAEAPPPVLSQDEKIQELYQWYNRYGSCSKKTLKGMIRKMGPSCGMEPSDVNLLPWVGQSYIDASAMKDLLIVNGK